MKYHVEYETSTLPAELPDGAKVTELPLLPFSLDTKWGRKITVHPQIGSSPLIGIGNTETGDFVNASISQQDARDIAHALFESIGEPLPSAAPVGPSFILDGDGDYWSLRSDGDWGLATFQGKQRYPEVSGEKLSFIDEHYDGYTVLR